MALLTALVKAEEFSHKEVGLGRLSAPIRLVPVLSFSAVFISVCKHMLLMAYLLMTHPEMAGWHTSNA